MVETRAHKNLEGEKACKIGLKDRTKAIGKGIDEGCMQSHS